MSRIPLAAAFAVAVTLALAAPTAFAGARDYALDLVETTHPLGAGAILTVRLTDLRTRTPVTDAVIFATRMDMAPDGMAAMTSPVTALPITALPITAPGLYRFATDLSMAGNWRFSLAAKLQGEAATIKAELTLQVQP